MASRRLATLSAAAALLLAAPLSARAFDSSFYAAVKGGAWIPSANPGWNVGDQQGKLPTSGDLEIALGAREGLWGLQVAAGYTWASVAGAGYEVTTGSIPFYGLGQFRLPIPYVEPYVELGLGGFATFGTATIANPGGSVSTDAGGLSILAIVGIGVDVILDRFLVGVEVRENFVLSETHGWGTLSPSALSVTLNVGYALF